MRPIRSSLVPVLLVAIPFLANPGDLLAEPPEIVLQQAGGGSVELVVTTPADAFRTEVQQSDDLVAWNPVRTIADGGVVDRIPLTIDRARSFYRAVTQPRPGTLGNLWCLGDSWTDCFLNYSWRRKLSQDLEGAGWALDFVGTLNTPLACEAGQVFDRDHNGVSGITAEEVLNNRLPGWLSALDPDTVLLLLGGNDLLAGATTTTILTRLESIMDAIRADNPDVVIYAAIYGYVDVLVPDAFVDSFAVALKALVASKTTVQSPVYFVDHRVGWIKAIHLDPSDQFHPSDAGMQKMADNWLSAIQANF
jgi:hypothetical protein